MTRRFVDINITNYFKVINKKKKLLQPGLGHLDIRFICCPTNSKAQHNEEPRREKQLQSPSKRESECPVSDQLMLRFIIIRVDEIHKGVHY